jgi:hypothetical protein
MSVAYSCGLLLAFVAVLLMEQGQPALLYICPICLAVMFIMGRHRLKDLWSGAKVFKLADQLISKNERKWGKIRMKRFVEKRKRENAAMYADAAVHDESSRLSVGEDECRRSSSVEPAESDAVAAAGGEGPPEQRLPPGGGRRSSGRGGPGRGGQRTGRGHPGPGTKQRSRKSLTNAGQIETVPREGIPDTPLEPSLTLKPSLKDICFGDEAHPGTIEFRHLVKMEVTRRNADDDGRREVFKSIGMKLKGRRFFKEVRSNEWVVASKFEIRTEVGKAYDFEVNKNADESVLS